MAFPDYPIGNLHSFPLNYKEGGGEGRRMGDGGELVGCLCVCVCVGGGGVGGGRVCVCVADSSF